MPMSQTEMERRVTQQGADIDAIYEIVSRVEAVQQQHSARFDIIDGRFDGIDSRLDGIDSRLDQVATGVAEVLRRLPD